MQVTQIYAHFAPAYDSDIERLTIQKSSELGYSINKSDKDKLTLADSGKW